MQKLLARCFVQHRATVGAIAMAAVLCAQPARGLAQDETMEEADTVGEANDDVDVPAAASETTSESADEPHVSLAGWVEAYWAWSTNEPSNGIIDLRGFDNRHASFNLSNVVLDATGEWRDAYVRVAVQWGATPATYYLAETSAPASGAGIGAQDAALWQWLQQAYAGYRIPVGTGLDVSAGLFLSPVGVEGLAVKDNWLYSRTNLFFGFPFYHTGIRAYYALTDEVRVAAWVINGWNTVLDNNDEKSFMVQATFAVRDLLTGSFSYVSGVERPRNAPEGRAWRHTFDLNGTITPTSWLAFQTQATAGFEPNAFGTSAYAAGMLTARVTPLDWLALAVRGDFFWERASSNATGAAAPIFWPAEWVSSVTAGLTLAPHDNIAVHLDYRHDQAASDAYFQGAVVGDGATTPFIRNARAQNTLTIGTTVWF